MSRRTLVLSFVLAASVLLAGAYWWLQRPGTLEWAADRIARATAQSVVFERVNGSLLGVIHADRVRWRSPTGEVIFDDVDLVWSPLQLFAGTVAFDQARARSARLFLRTADQATPAGSARMPLRLRFDQIAVGQLIVERRDPLQFLDVRLGMTAGRDAVSFRVDRLPAYGMALSGPVKIGYQRPNDIDLRLEARREGADAARAPPLLTVQARGTFDTTRISAQAASGSSHGSLEAVVHPRADRKVEWIVAEVPRLDPRDFDADAPHASLRGALAAFDGTDRGLTGALRLENSEPGPLDESALPLRSLRGAVAPGEEGPRVNDLVIDLGPAGRLTGAGGFDGSGLDAKLTARELDLSRVHGALKATKLAGGVTVQGGSAEQHLRLNLGDRVFRYAADMTVTPQQVVVRDATIGGAGGSARGSGRIALTGSRAFELTARLVGFDPAAFGKVRSASLNGRIEARGEWQPVLLTQGRAAFAPSTAFGLPASGRIVWKSRGAGQPVVELDADTRIGPTRLRAKGVLADPENLDSLDLALTVEGNSLFELTNVFGVPFPETTAPFHIDGRLTYRDAVWELREFHGGVGRSDLSGRFAIDRSRPRTSMRGELASNRLDIRDLWGFVGADTRLLAQAPGKVLPRGRFDPATLRRIDADVHFAGRSIVNEKLPLRAMEARLRMRDGEVRVDPLLFRAAGGEVAGRVTLDAREAVLTGTVDMQARDLALARIAPSTQAAVGNTGSIDARALLHLRGNTVADMLGAANGNVRVLMQGGSMSDLALRLANLDLANAAAAAAKGDQPIAVRCLVADLPAREGVLETRRLLLDTEHTLLVGTGHIDLRDEALALRVVAEPKDPSLLSLRGPIRVEGTFADPQVRPELANALARIGAAAALGAVAGPLALIPFLQMGERKEVDCASLIAESTPFVAGATR